LTEAPPNLKTSIYVQLNDCKYTMTKLSNNYTFYQEMIRMIFAMAGIY
jgi:hypothetical protein